MLLHSSNLFNLQNWERSPSYLRRQERRKLLRKKSDSSFAAENTREKEDTTNKAIFVTLTTTTYDSLLTLHLKKDQTVMWIKSD